MKKSFNADYIKNNKGCYSTDQIEELLKTVKGKEMISTDDILNSDIPLKDKYWFIIRKTKLTDNQKREIAIMCAETVLFLYEEKYPDDKRPREAIQAAKDYLVGIIDIEDLRKKRDAAYAAYDAAAVAYDVAAYAAAAAVAYDVAAYAAAAAVDAAAAKPSLNTILLQKLKDFVNNN